MRFVQEYPGVHGILSTCAVHIVELNGRAAIVLEQLKERSDGGSVGTSITNMIEDLAELIVNRDLKGLKPHEIRVFEYYPKDQLPLYSWSEVFFNTTTPSNWEMFKGVIEIGIQRLLSNRDRFVWRRWYYSEPRWVAVSDETIGELEERMF